MEREIELKDITDGKLYELNDMVKAGCADCAGCFACCQDMGTSITLDPLDVHWLTTGLKRVWDELLGHNLELNVVDGVILPNLMMTGTSQRCSFLNSQGRCEIHSFRPGICRLFPLGRYYEDHAFHYILQIHECKKEHKSKVKVRKWIDTPDLKSYEVFILNWHYFLKDLQILMNQAGDYGLRKDLNLYLLNQFYLTPYDAELGFYAEFQERYLKAKDDIEKLVHT